MQWQGTRDEQFSQLCSKHECYAATRRQCQIYIESGKALTQGPVTLGGAAPNPARGILVVVIFVPCFNCCRPTIRTCPWVESYRKMRSSSCEVKIAST